MTSIISSLTDQRNEKAQSYKQNRETFTKEFADIITTLYKDDDDSSEEIADQLYSLFKKFLDLDAQATDLNNMNVEIQKLLLKECMRLCEENTPSIYGDDSYSGTTLSDLMNGTGDPTPIYYRGRWY